MAEPAVTPQAGGEGTDVHSTLKAYVTERSPILSSIIKPEEINAEESDDTEANVVDEPEVEEEVSNEVEDSDEDQDSEEVDEDQDLIEALDEDADDEDTESPQEVDLEAKVKVKVDGEEFEITVEEATRGYQRERDYVRKTEEVANLKKALLDESSQLKQGLEMVQSFMTAELKAYDEVDWAALKAENPNEYLLKREEYDSAVNRIKGVYATYQQVVQAEQVKQQELAQEAAQAELTRLGEIMPELTNEETRKAKGQQWLNAAQSLGFSEEEFLSVADHRLFIMLDKAMKYDALIAKREAVKDKKVRNKGKQVKKGQRRDSDASQSQKQEQAVMDRFTKQQDVDSAAGLIAQRLRSK